MKFRQAIRVGILLQSAGRALALLAMAAWLHTGLTFVAPSLFAAHAALPTCSIAVYPINFGYVNLFTNTAIDGVGQLQIYCNGGEAGKTVYACVNFGEGVPASGTGSPRGMSNGTAQIFYELYMNSSRTTVWGSNDWGFAAKGQKFQKLLDSSGSGSLTGVPIYIRVPAGQQAAPIGWYSGSLSGSHLVLRYSYTNSTECNSGVSAMAYGDLTVTAQNIGGCTMSASNMVFPNGTILSASTDAVSTITATCSGDKPYKIGLDLGLGSGVVDATARKMTGGGGAITYGLYRDAARSQPWGPDSSQLYSGTGNGNVQTINVYGRVPAQTTPPAGTYSDTIIATITY